MRLAPLSAAQSPQATRAKEALQATQAKESTDGSSRDGGMGARSQHDSREECAAKEDNASKPVLMSLGAWFQKHPQPRSATRPKSKCVRSRGWGGGCDCLQGQ